MLLSIFRTIFDWSEVWALLIPLTVLLIFNPNGDWVTPIKWYLLTAFLLNLCVDFIWYVNKEEWFGVSEAKKNWWNNNIFYNLHSFARLFFFSWFFSIQGVGLKKIARMVPVVFLSAVIIFFTIKKDGFNYNDPAEESIFYISSYLLATEAGLLLFYCLWYTNKIMREDKPAFSSSNPPFWVVGGLTIFTSVNFFVFLFYDFMNVFDDEFLVSIWDLHNSLFIILCICIAIGLYNERRTR
jgi:hypothetical protein